mgnify:CR=1 FL=1
MTGHDIRIPYSVYSTVTLALAFRKKKLERVLAERVPPANGKGDYWQNELRLVEQADEWLLRNCWPIYDEPAGPVPGLLLFQEVS